MVEAVSAAAASEPASNATEEEKATEHQSPTMEETFADPVVPELKFRCDWTLWEHYEAHGDAQMDYTSSMCKACWFNDLVSFSTAWNTIPHRELTNVFYNEDTRTVNL